MSILRDYDDDVKDIITRVFDKLPSAIKPPSTSLLDNENTDEVEYQNEEVENEEADDDEIENVENAENELENAENEFENELENGFVDEIGARDRAGGEHVVRDKKYYASRTEKEIFLDSIAIELKKYYNETYQKGDLFDILSDRHPHPRFLNPLLCISVAKFFYLSSTRTYRYTKELYERYKTGKRGPTLLPYDLIRYTSLFSRYLN